MPAGGSSDSDWALEMAVKYAGRTGAETGRLVAPMALPRGSDAPSAVLRGKERLRIE